MIIDNKLDKTLNGPSIFLGISFLVIGIILLVVENWILGSIGILIALFLLFSYSGINIDTKNRTIRPYNKFFGIIKTGKWESLEKYIGLTLVPMNRIYSIYSRSNRRNLSVEKEYRVYLVNKAKKPALPLKKCRTMKKAQNCMDEFSIWLKMPVYTINR